ncbi:hypothetical protein BHK98_02575 [Hornefia porci]|uniref:HK97 gp10 family phage protein n=1 Tax=Hornefia porci TaxID=2652292 RepID=A0A1Q9JFS2_9FIRM|nr:HK97 gp10 family phage protein [Hornefia porci]OLR55048.1 hypothetical protein BHK98_02575 [Hornefia porci]
MKKIKPEQLSDEIIKMLEEYKDAADQDVEISVKQVSKETKKRVTGASPRKYGGYSKGWSVRREQNFRGKHSVVIHNRKKPGLTHLLEKGHAKRGGGRVPGKEHIAPAESYAIKEIEAEIRRRLKV